MHTLRSWWALFGREYLEHRIAFLWFPIGVVVLLALSGASALSFAVSGTSRASSCPKR